MTNDSPERAPEHDSEMDEWMDAPMGPRAPEPVAEEPEVEALDEDSNTRDWRVGLTVWTVPKAVEAAIAAAAFIAGRSIVTGCCGCSTKARGRGAPSLPSRDEVRARMRADKEAIEANWASYRENAEGGD